MLDLIQARVPLRWSRSKHKRYACEECRVFHKLVSKPYCSAAAPSAGHVLWYHKLPF